MVRRRTDADDDRASGVFQAGSAGDGEYAHGRTLRSSIDCSASPYPALTPTAARARLEPFAGTVSRDVGIWGDGLRRGARPPMGSALELLLGSGYLDVPICSRLGNCSGSRRFCRPRLHMLRTLPR